MHPATGLLPSCWAVIWETCKWQLSHTALDCILCICVFVCLCILGRATIWDTFTLTTQSHCSSLLWVVCIFPFADCQSMTNHWILQSTDCFGYQNAPFTNGSCLRMHATTYLGNVHIHPVVAASTPTTASVRTLLDWFCIVLAQCTCTIYMYMYNCTWTESHQTIQYH